MKHNIDKPEIEEMLSRYIDGEASERECTEIKRLAANDEVFADRIVRMEKQRQLLANLPSEIAPSWLVSDIKQSLERRLLLNEQPEFTDDATGVRSLILRHFMTAAIIIFLFGGLIFIVMQVLLPSRETSRVPIASMGPGGGATKIAEKGSDGVITSTYRGGVEVFSVSLELKSSDSSDINNHISKVVYVSGMLEDTYKDKQDNITYYYVTTDIEKVRVLLEELSPVWSKCKKVKLTALGIENKSDVIIENATAAQTLAIFKQDKLADRIDVARDFADFNAVVGAPEERDSFANRLAIRDREDALDPEKPGLTSGRKMPSNLLTKLEGERVSLKITVEGI